MSTTTLTVDDRAETSAQKLVPAFAGAMLLCAVAACLLAGWTPIGFSIATAIHVLINYFAGLYEREPRLGYRPWLPRVAVAMAGSTSVTSGTVSLDARTKAKMQGYEGEACGECGNYTLVRNGTCMKCNTCGATSGCS